MENWLTKIAIKYLSRTLSKNKLNVAYVIRSNGHTIYKVDKGNIGKVKENVNKKIAK